MASEVDIMNRALQLLGAEKITDVDEDSPNARSCNAAYRARRRALLRTYAWSFSIRRYSLAADTATPEFGYDFQYQWPSEALRILAPDVGSFTQFRDWQMEGRKILTNDLAPLEVRAVIDIEDVEMMDPLFCEALAADLAENLCEEITQSNTKKQIVRDIKREAIQEARRCNAIERGSVQSAEDDWSSVRRGP